MGNIQLLDCTLRDGGYINDWEFGHENLTAIFQRLVDARVDMIEIGFLDEQRPFDWNRSIMPDTACVKNIYGDLEKKGTKVVGMIDYGTCSLGNIQPASESFLDGIRVIFKKHLRREAVAFCQKLKDLGYLVFVQMVSATSYTEEETMDLALLANDMMPYALTIVDTYGLMHPDCLLHYFDILDQELNPKIKVGYHGHNNFQMAYANCMEYLKQGISRQRDLIVDASLYGMGKAAGNLPIELAVMHLNTAYGENYGISPILEAIEEIIFSFYNEPSWGYNLYYYMAAYHGCHPGYVFYLAEKQGLSATLIHKILEKVEAPKKLTFQEAYMEKLYMDSSTCL